MDTPKKRNLIKYPRLKNAKSAIPQNSYTAQSWRNPATDWIADNKASGHADKDLFEWPRLYHTHHIRSLEDLPFWLSLARQQKSPILELGCGTGRVTIPLVQAGYIVYGLDRDSLMLEYLKSLINFTSDLPLYIIQADMSEFQLAKKFPLIMLPCNTLSTLSPKLRQAMWVCMKNHLTQGGLFAASLPNPRMLANLPLHSDIELEDAFLHPVNGEPIQVSSSWDHDFQYFNLSWYYDHLFPDGSVERKIISTQHDLSPLEVYLEEMAAAELHLESAYGDFDFSRYGKNSPNLILVIKKC